MKESKPNLFICEYISKFSKEQISLLAEYLVDMQEGRARLLSEKIEYFVKEKDALAKEEIF